MTPEQIVEFAEELGRLAAAGGGPRALAGHLAASTGAGVLVEDLGGNRIASSGEATLPASARGLNGVAKTLPIAAGATQFGWLSLIPNGTTDFAHLLPAGRLAASAMAVELARDASAGPGGKHAFWERLASGAYHDLGAAREDANACGVLLAPHYLCVALDAEKDDASAGTPLTELRVIVQRAFHADEHDIGIVERGNTLIILVPTPREVDAENAKTAAMLLPKTAAKRGPNPRLTGGCSRVGAPVEIARGVRHAEAALAITRRLFGGGRVSAYDALGAYPLLYHGATLEELQRFSASVLEPLRAYDERHQTELERTLRVYFSTGQNIKTTAAELAVHRHTVFYRLRQISEISARTLESAHDQLTLRLAMAIDALHS